MVKKTIYSFDLGTSAWRIAHSMCEVSANQPSQILTQPVPVLLNNFNNPKSCLPVAVMLNCDKELQYYGQSAYYQLKAQNQLNNWYENFNLSSTNLLQSLELTQLLLTEIIQQIDQERPNYDSENCLYLFSYPNHWNEELIREFQQLVKNCLPHKEVDFVPESQGLLLGVLNTGFVNSSDGKYTLIIDLSESKVNFFYGSNLNQEYQELELISFPNQDLFDSELISYLAEKLSISVTKNDFYWVKLKQYASQIKESFSKITESNHLITMNLLLGGDSEEIINQSIQLTFREFEEIIQPSVSQIKQIVEQFFQQYLAPEKISQIILTGGNGNNYFLTRIFEDKLLKTIPLIFCKNPERLLVNGTALWYVIDSLYPFIPKVISGNEKQAEIYHQQAITKIKQENYQGAKDDLNHALALKPDYRDAYFNRSQVLYKLQDYQGSINDLEVTINMNSQDYYAYYRMGSSLLEQENYRQAISSYTQALQKNPNLVEGYLERGISQYYLGNFDLAKHDINEAISLSPKLVNFELNKLKKQNTKGLFRFNKSKKSMDELIKLIECLLEGIGVKKSGSNPLTALAETLNNLVKLLPVEPDTVNVLTYKEAMEYFVIEKPLQPEEIKGALLRQPHSKGYLITQVFIDDKNDLICRQDGSPYGRKLVAKNLDNELLENFGNTNLIIATK